MHPVIPVSVKERSGCILPFSNGDMSIIKWIKDRLGQKKRTLRQSRLEYCLGAMNLRIDELVPIEGVEYESFLSDLKRKVGQLPPEPEYITQDVRMPDGQIIRGYTLHNIFTWKEVVESLDNRIREAYRVKGSTCDECEGEGLTVACFRSSKDSWKSLCGREGYMLICTDCMKMLKFKEYIMN